MTGAARRLDGLSLLVTRPEGKSDGLSDVLIGLGATVRTEALTRTVPLDDAEYAPLDAALAALDRYDWLLVTSAEGVRFCLARGAARGLPGRLDTLLPPGVRLAAIGSATAAACRAAGRAPDLLPAEFHAEGLVAALAAEPKGLTARFLLVRAETARDVLPDTIRAAGGTLDVAPAYRAVTDPAAVARAAAALAAGQVELLVAASGAPLTALAEALPAAGITDPARVRVAAIGPVTAARAAELGMTVALTAPRATLESLVESLVAHRGREDC